MLVWLNGTFGVGKSTTARLIAEGSTGRWRPFDPEWVGFMLKANLADRSLGGDFQNLVAWRRLVPVIAREVRDFTGQHLAAAQTVLVEDYWTELRRGLVDEGFDVFHVLLDATSSALRDRIAADASTDAVHARQWRLDHLDEFESSRKWMAGSADLVVDTSASPPDEVARLVLESIK